MGLRCWNGATCRSGCLVPCRPPLNEIDPRRVLTAPEIDWRKILKVYIGAILQAESITFMHEVPSGALTDVERAALLSLDAEVKRETPYD